MTGSSCLQPHVQKIHTLSVAPASDICATSADAIVVATLALASTAAEVLASDSVIVGRDAVVVIQVALEKAILEGAIAKVLLVASGAGPAGDARACGGGAACSIGAVALQRSVRARHTQLGVGTS